MSENVALIGADPELFVQRGVKDRAGRLQRYDMLPAFGLFGGNKDKPIAMFEDDKEYAYLEDNAALEFNIPPQKTAKEFSAAIVRAKNWLLANKLDTQGLMMSESNCLLLEGKYQFDPRGREVGCSKDWDAYGQPDRGIEREPFTADMLGDKRYAGGHFHLSYNHDVIPQYVAARFLDVLLTLPYLDYDRQFDRRGTYGKPGLYRPKKYGIEYRTMSNFWLWNSAACQDLAERALTFARRSYEPEYLKILSDAYVGMPWGDVQRAVINEDYDLGRQLTDLANNTYNLGGRPRRR